MKEIFDRVKTHLLAQGETAQGNTMCVYHSQSGLKCAVGCLITEKAYSEELEGETVDDAQVKDALKASGISLDRSTLDMLLRLQSIHDEIGANRWGHALDNLEAKLFGDAE